jgi:TonB family protein
MAFSMFRFGLICAGAVFGACLLEVSPAAAQAARAEQTDANGTSSSSNGYSDIWSNKIEVQPSYSEAAGAPCTGGSGVIVCPTLKSAGDTKAIVGILGTVKGKELKLKFCVSAQGLPEDAEVTQSTGKERADREMLKFIKTYRYNPGTVDGAPARVCDVVAAFRF